MTTRAQNITNLRREIHKTNEALEHEQNGGERKRLKRLRFVLGKAVRKLAVKKC